MNHTVSAEELERRAIIAMKMLITLESHFDKIRPGRLVKEGTRAYVNPDSNKKRSENIL